MGPGYFSAVSDQQGIASILHWSHLHAALMLFAILLQWYLGQPLWLVLLAALSLGYYGFNHRSYYADMWLGIGRANLLTLFRLLVLGLVVLYFNAIPALVSAIILIGCVILDGFDGHLARRYAESSDFGHYLDVETDAFAIALLAALLWHHEDIPALVLLAGALRYAYVWLVKLTVTEQVLEPKRRYASVIAVTVYVVMTIRLAFDHVFFTVVLWFSLALLVASFARSIVYQWRH